MYFIFNRETVVRVTGGMKVKADRDEVGYQYSCLLQNVKMWKHFAAYKQPAGPKFTSVL